MIAPVNGSSSDSTPDAHLQVCKAVLSRLGLYRDFKMHGTVTFTVGVQSGQAGHLKITQEETIKLT